MNDDLKDIQSIEERIALLRKKKENDAIPNRHTKSSQTIKGLQISIELVSGVIVGGSIGYILDEMFDFGSTFLVFMIILGCFAGLLNVVRYLNKTLNTKEDREE